MDFGKLCQHIEGSLDIDRQEQLNVPVLGFHAEPMQALILGRDTAVNDELAHEASLGASCSAIVTKSLSFFNARCDCQEIDMLF